MLKRVVITEAGVLTCLGRGLEKTYEAFLREESKLSKIVTFATNRYASENGGVVEDCLIDIDLDENERAGLDRSSHIVYTACKDALSSALVDLNQLRFSKTPVYLGTTLGGTLKGQMFHHDYVLKQNKRKRVFLLKDYLACNQTVNLSKKFNLTGEALLLNNACASGLNAIGVAFSKIRNGYEDFVVAGGYDVMSKFVYAGFNSLQLLASGKCRPFDKNRSGLVLGEGAGVVVVEELDHAMKRGAAILAEIIGFGQTADAYHLTKPDPQAIGATEAIKTAKEMAGIATNDIDYINAHGTGTLANDSMESLAIITALGEGSQKIPVSSTKPMTGHMLGGTGAVEAVFSLLSISKNIIPGNLNYETFDAECDLNIVREKMERKEIKTVMSNSFGFGGSNSSIILRELNEN